MAQSTIAAKIDDVERSYRMPEGDKIKAYLAAHRETADILLEARPHIELQFGCSTVVELRIPRDYEGDPQGELLAMIQSHQDADAALDRFDRLWDEWWGEASGHSESWPLYIGVEYAGEPVQ
ncbi:MAG: hypothetical protein LAQ69_19065 [Acidobacteriia bacterium]|nr:hypothetical protein [Terriglobia bacterium]